MIRITAVALAVFTLIAAPALADQMLSPFAGSEVLGTYAVDFEQLPIAIADGDGYEIVMREGQLTSGFYRKPGAKTNLEVFRSYRNELTAAGFDILIERTPEHRGVRSFGSDLYKTNGRFTNRSYTGDGPHQSEQNWLATFIEYYLSATKTEGGKTVHVAVFLSDRRDLYAVDVLTAAAMETGTVTLSLDALRAGIDSKGSIAIYDILFNTGSADIRPESEAALGVLTTYIQNSSGSGYYIVGHTDDTGDLAANMQLSEARAGSVVAALKTRGVNVGRITAYGVGPLAPVATNDSDDGRQQNRRVELVRMAK